jgi:raffinose/stachyose/melibiose transport system substrate-binding protein
MVLNSKDAPDLLEYNKGNATAGLLSKQGLLTDLTGEVTKRGWDKLVTGGLATTARYSPDGVMGSGKWYGVPNYAEYLMVYYNKDLFAKYGIAVPTTFEQLTAAMDTLVKNGVTPFANAGAEYLAQQYLYQLALSKAERSWVDDYEEYQGKVDFHDEAWTFAATTFADWVKKGYIAKTSISTKADGAGNDFLRGKAAMLFSGSWWAGTFEKQASFGWDTFLWPGSKLTPGSSGNLWVVPASAEPAAKELAYDFIDITMSKANQNLLGNSGGVPVAADAAAITDPKAKQLIANFDTLADGDGLAFYPDWPVPGFYDVLLQQTQKLMTGGDPSAVLDQLQKAYDAGAPKS